MKYINIQMASESLLSRGCYAAPEERSDAFGGRLMSALNLVGQYWELWYLICKSYLTSNSPLTDD